MRVVVKTFCPVETKSAPPSVWAKITIDVPTGMRGRGSTVWTASMGLLCWRRKVRDGYIFCFGKSQSNG